MTPAEDAEALHAEVKALRAEVREVVAILENWERRPPTVTTRGGRCDKRFVRILTKRSTGSRHAAVEVQPLRPASAPMMVRPEGQEQMRHGTDRKRVEIRHGEGRPGCL